MNSNSFFLEIIDDTFKKVDNDKFIYLGRKDSLLVHSTGEKTAARKFESPVLALCEVKACLVVGHGRQWPSMFVEANWPAMERKFSEGEEKNKQAAIWLKDNVWKIVQKVNNEVILPNDLSVDRRIYLNVI